MSDRAVQAWPHSTIPRRGLFVRVEEAGEGARAVLAGGVGG